MTNKLTWTSVDTSTEDTPVVQAFNPAITVLKLRDEPAGSRVPQRSARRQSAGVLRIRH